MNVESPVMHEGIIVSVSTVEIVSTTSAGENQCHTLAEQAKVTCDGKTCKLETLKVGLPVRITNCKQDASKASVVSAGRKQSIPYG